MLPAPAQEDDWLLKKEADFGLEDATAIISNTSLKTRFS